MNLNQHQSHAVEGGATNVNEVDEAAVDSFLREWGVDQSVSAGGLVKSSDGNASEGVVPRKVYLLQRKEGKLGATLGKTTVSNIYFMFYEVCFMHVCMYVCMYVCRVGFIALQ